MKTSLVTGGASGIGQAIAGALRADGHRVLVVDLADNPGLRGDDYLQVDLATAEGIARLRDRLGGMRIDHVVHCAALGHYSGFADTPRNTRERVVQVNLLGTMDLIEAVEPHMHDEGRILLFASGTVFKGPANMTAYVASKAGVVGFARSLAAELGHRGITVNVVCPGMTDTPMITDMAHTEDANIATRAIQRRQVPADLVGPVRFFLSEGAAFVTGQTLCVDGGSVRR